MPTGAGLLNKISGVIRKTHVTSQVVRFRTVLSRDGNPLLGIGVTRANLDEDIDPQPVVEIGTGWTGLVTPEMIASGANMMQLGDYLFTFDGNVAETMLQTADILYGDDLLKIVNYVPIVFDATVVGWQVYARTVKAN